MKVERLLDRRDIEGVRHLARRNAYVPRTLVAILSELDDVVRWRAIEALGWVVADMARKDLEKARDLVRRLFWSMTEECGGTAWHAPEAVGEILARVPALARDFTSVLAGHADEDPYQVGVLWSLQRLATSQPVLVLDEVDVLLRAAESPLAAKRGHAATALSLVKSAEDILDRLSADPAALSVYDRSTGTMKRTTVQRLARVSLESAFGARAQKPANRA